MSTSISSTVAGEVIGIKILIFTLMSANLVYHQLLWDYPFSMECGINRAMKTIRPSGLFLQENHQEPRVPGNSCTINTSTLPSLRYVCLYIRTMCRWRKGHHQEEIKSSYVTEQKCCITHKFHLKFWVIAKSIKVCENPPSISFLSFVPLHVCLNYKCLVLSLGSSQILNYSRALCLVQVDGIFFCYLSIQVLSLASQQT